MTSQTRKISLEEAIAAVDQALNAWPRRPSTGDWSSDSWDAYLAAETEPQAALAVMGARISDYHPATGRRMRLAGVTATCTSSAHDLLRNWLAAARQRLCDEVAS